MSINVLALSGHLGADSELRYTNSKLAVLNFSLAVNESVSNGDGTYRDYTNWIDCVMFGKRAEALAAWLQKGSKVSLIGRIHTSTYDSNGAKLKRWQVRVDNIELMQCKAEKKDKPNSEIDPGEIPGIYESDVPF